jgi:hypothetical protein
MTSTPAENVAGIIHVVDLSTRVEMLGTVMGEVDSGFLAAD